MGPLTSSRVLTEPELVPVGTPVDPLQLLDMRDIRARFGELNPLPARPPGVDVLLPRVVCGECEPLVPAVLDHQVMEVPRPVADVELRVVQVAEHELRAAGADRDALRGRRLQLHQADRACARLRIRAELRLLVDHCREQRRVQVVVLRMRAHDARVAKRIPEARPPGRLRLLQVHERSGSGDRDRAYHDEAPQDDESLSTTPATKASRSASEPSFTYEKSARLSF